MVLGSLIYITRWCDDINDARNVCHLCRGSHSGFEIKELSSTFPPGSRNFHTSFFVSCIVIVLRRARISLSTFNMYFFVYQAFACHGSASFCSVEDTACSSTRSRHLCTLVAHIARGVPSTKWSIQSLNCDGHQLLSTTRLLLSARTLSRGRLHRFSHSLGRHRHRIKRSRYHLFRALRHPKHIDCQRAVPRASTVAPFLNMHLLLSHGETKNT